MDTPDHLATHRRCNERIHVRWPHFQERRLERLKERERFGHAAERATEEILGDLFTLVLDWSVGDLNHQVEHADILLTRLGIKYLVVEAKRPGSLAWSRSAVTAALDQACRYAAEQKVRCVAVSDGVMLYAADVAHGGLRDRVFCSLEHADPQETLWWLSVEGIHRERPGADDAALGQLAEETDRAAEVEESMEASGELLHPKYGLPARCFAYVGRADDPHTWHLPYLDADGGVDVRRLPKAAQAIVSDYRGARVMSIPESDIGDVLVRLACAASSLGRMPTQTPSCAPVYAQLAAALDQLGRLNEVH